MLNDEQKKQPNVAETFGEIEPVIEKKQAENHSFLNKVEETVETFAERETKTSREEVEEAIMEVKMAEKMQAEKVQQEEKEEPIVYPEVKLKEKNFVKENLSATQTQTSKKASLKEKICHPENWRSLQMLPPKYRRPFVVLFLFVLVLIFIALLRPNEQSVQSFDGSNNHQFAFEGEGKAVGGLSSILEPQDLEESNQITSTEEHSLTQAPFASLDEESTTAQADATVQPLAENAQDNTLPSIDEVNIAGAETPAQAVQPEVEPSMPDEPVAQKVSAKTTNNDVFAALEKANLLNADSELTQKTLVIKKGVSLMQTFRNYHLNASEVLMMDKVKKLNSFNAGDKVLIKVNAQNQVMEMQLPQGGKFIRQANGRYRFQR